jgi:hypothetical protein
MVDYTTLTVDPELAEEVRQRREENGATTNEVLAALLNHDGES